MLPHFAPPTLALDNDANEDNRPQRQRKIKRLRIGKPAHHHKQQQSKNKCLQRPTAQRTKLSIEATVKTCHHRYTHDAIGIELLQEFIVCMSGFELPEGRDHLPERVQAM